MIKITAKIDGMMCGMCESHVNDALRKAFEIKKVTDSDISDDALRSALEPTGYTFVSAAREPYQKKGLFR